MTKYAIVIGGSGGIGSEVARLFDLKGVQPIIVDKVKLQDNKYPFIACDLAEVKKFPETMTRISKLCEEPPYYIVNSAGIFGAHSDGLFDRKRLEKVMDVNVIGTQLLLQEWFGLFGKKHGGVAVNISSAAGRRGTSDVAYGMSKAALDSATRSLARTWASSSVWVFGVAPGLVTTKMARPMSKERRERLVNNSLMKRETTAAELADLTVAIALASPSLVAGTIIDASGGI